MTNPRATIAHAIDHLLPAHGPERLFRIGPVTGHRRDGQGHATAAMPVPTWAGWHGTPAAGALGVLMDDTLGHASLQVRPVDHWVVTTQLDLQFVDSAAAGSGGLVATSTTMHHDNAGTSVSGRAVDASGRLRCVGTLWSRFVPGVPERTSETSVPDLDADTSGSVGELLGIEWSGRQNAFVLPYRPVVLNSSRAVHGGILATAAEFTGTAALPASPLVAASLHVTYLRLAVTDLTFHSEVVHAGRALAVVDVVARTTSGKPCLAATVTYRSTERARAGTTP